MRMRNIIFILLLLALPMPLPAETKALADYQAVFLESMSKIKDAHMARCGAIDQQYRESLTRLRSTVKRKGDLEGFVAVKKEQERFAAAKEVPAESPADASPVIVQVQSEYRRLMAEANHDRRARSAALLTSYLKYLTDLQKEYVMQEDIKRAMEVKKEIDLAQTMLAVEEKEMAKHTEEMLAKTPPKPPPEPKRVGPEITFVQEKSMKLWPKGYKQMHFPQQETEDATSPFEGKPVYFNQKSGRDVVYDIRYHKPVKSVLWKGAAMKDMTIEILDMEGNRVAQGGPYQGGNRWGEYKVEFEPRRDFVLKVSNYVSTWLLIDTLTLE